ncbi:hypothetical protein KEM55_000945 [Ascosphaera atra]|nr:hypothetical protein KEM55_000945 [Ascosphaera atra]
MYNGSDGAAVQTKQLHEKEDVGQNTKQKDAQRQASGGATEDVVGALRADLAQAQRSRADLQRRLAKVNEELELSREGARKSSKKVELLTGERNTLSRRLKDRDEELKGKAKLLDVCCATSFLRNICADYICSGRSIRGRLPGFAT